MALQEVAYKPRGSPVEPYLACCLVCGVFRHELFPPRSSVACTQRNRPPAVLYRTRSEEHTSELQSRQYLVCRLLLEKKNNNEMFPRRTLQPAGHTLELLPALAVGRPTPLAHPTTRRLHSSHAILPDAHIFLQHPIVS